MELKRSHLWNLSPTEAIILQKQWASLVSSQKPQHEIRYIAGIDCAPSQDKQFYFSAAVIWDIQQKKIIEQHIAKTKLTFPYIPGLLSFREIPTILEAIKKIKTEPDAIMVDGHGIAHPRRFGIACHLGVLLECPSFGCGKSLLYGRYQEPGIERGSSSPLLARDGNIIGQVLRTRAKVKPVIISIGHLIDLETAVNLVLACDSGYRLPEPTRQADRLVALKKEL